MDDETKTTTEYRVRWSTSDGTRWIHSTETTDLAEAEASLARHRRIALTAGFGGPDRLPRIEQRTVTTSAWKAQK